MKSKLFLFAAILAVVSFSSCKKEYECECTTGLTGTTVTETHKGKDAQDACDDASSVLQLKVCTPK